jgi:hypothetical protein
MNTIRLVQLEVGNHVVDVKRVLWVVELRKFGPNHRKRLNRLIIGPSIFSWFRHVNHMILTEHSSQLVASTGVNTQISNFVVNRGHSSSTPYDNVIF